MYLHVHLIYYMSFSTMSFYIERPGPGKLQIWRADSQLIELQMHWLIWWT